MMDSKSVKNILDAFKRLYRNTLFRLTLLAASLFAVSSIVSLGYVYFATIKLELNRVDRDILTEIEELKVLYGEKGPDALMREVILRQTSGEGLYLMQATKPDGPPLVAGNINEFPESATKPKYGLLPGQVDDEYRTVKFELTFRDSDASDLQARRSRAIAGPLKINDQITGILIVGRDVEPTMRNEERIIKAILTSTGIALVLGLLSGWYVSRLFSRRVEQFNRLATDVRAGHLERRAPRNYSEDELDLLAEHLNSMLDHIDTLMIAMRYAGDSIAHDLRSPLTRLRTRLETAAHDITDGHTSHILLSAADDANDLLRTFDSVLRIARLEAGERRELLVTLDPKTILDDIAELYEPACDDAGLTFKSSIKEGERILADRGLVSQAVSNLVENAIKYTPKGGTIHLVLQRTSHGRVEISVRDNGPGIPQLDRQRVKERFVRLEKSRTAPGSGLGLAMVDAIADLHRADFILSSGLPSDNIDHIGLTAALVFPRVKSRRHTPSV